jgi:ABC-type transporter Mla subunit MlaD
MMNMNNEEFDRKMAFIVKQQAQFASDIQRLQESQSQLQESQGRTDQVVAQTAEVVGQMAEGIGQMGQVLTRLAKVTHAGFTEVNAKINALVDAQIRTEENLSRTDENLRRTDENLRNFIAVVDRRFSEGQSGK